MTRHAAAKADGDGAFARAVSIVRATLWTVAFFTFFINLLALTSSVYMLQVYDRVLASRSLPTLAYLTLFATACLVTLALLEMVRSRLLVRMGIRFDAALAALVFRQTLEAGRNSQGLRDVEQLRTFFAGPTTLSLLDAPWMPLYIALVYLLHPWLGHVALVGAVALLALGLWNERSTRDLLSRSATESAASARFAESAARNSEVLRALGMVPALSDRWRVQHQAGLGLQGVASDRAGNVSAIAKAFRMLLQIGILGVGAWLVILQQTTAGVMIAASIIMGRGLAPLEAAIGSWRSVLTARDSYKRLRTELGAQAQGSAKMALPRPTGHLVFDGVHAGPPELRHVGLQNLAFEVRPGSVLGVTGPSGSGKSTLARVAIGIWRAKAGSVRLDGANIADWSRDELGPALGYLPQDVELFAGTVADNIARYGSADATAIVAAATTAGAHDVILALPEGYDTVLGAGGANLSGGQRQRIALSRAIYGDPSCVVLDEPTAHMDAEGEAAVRHLLTQLKNRGCSVLVIAHRPALLTASDHLLVLVDGRIAKYGETSELLPTFTRPASGHQAIAVGPDQGTRNG